MKLLFDANLSPDLARLLDDLYPGSRHVFDLGLGPNDQAIWDHAEAYGFTIVSKDGDFFHLSTVLGAPPKVIWLRVGNAGTNAIEASIRTRTRDLDQFDRDSTAAVLVVRVP